MVLPSQKMLLSFSFALVAWSGVVNSQDSTTTTTTTSTTTTTTTSSTDSTTTTDISDNITTIFTTDVFLSNTTDLPSNSTTTTSNLTTIFEATTTLLADNETDVTNTTTSTTTSDSSVNTTTPFGTVVPLTTTTTPSAAKCQEHKWPDLDDDKTCGTCKALVTNMNRKYQTCSTYCASIGRDCLGAWEEVQDSCVVKSIETCDHRFGSYTSDAICQCSDTTKMGPKRPESTVLKCFYKPATSQGKPQLQTCGKDEDACLIAYMRHEDGHFYTRQKCINSTIEAPFYRGHGGILQPYCRDWPLEGTYLCACDYSGCNWEKFSAGYITPTQRIAPLLILLLVIFGITCCCCCCFGSSEKKGAVHYR